jgi:hypothetical protein
MIQAGTISTGSGRTLSVRGAYWISSISALRCTTAPWARRQRLAHFEPVLAAHRQPAHDLLEILA